MNVFQKDITENMKPLIEILEVLESYWRLYEDGTLEDNPHQIKKIENSINTAFDMLFDNL